MALPFQTPDNEKSFSGLIDSAIMQTGKAGSLIAAVSFANLTIRECQSLGLFARDLREEQLAVDIVPFNWTRPVNFRRIRTVKYPDFNIYPKFMLPGKIQIGEEYYYYAADNYYVFKGVGQNNAVNLANYYFAKRLQYFSRLATATDRFPGGPYSVRPAYYDQLTEQWMYLNDTSDGYVTSLTDLTEELIRQLNTTNWLVTIWYDLILTGTKAKLFSGGDDNRANREFAAYKQAQKTFQTVEAYESEGF